MIFRKSRLGIMQGRLSTQVKNIIQIFPKKNWKQEFKKMKSLKLKNLEWTIEFPFFYENPLMDKNKHKEIINLKKKYKINIYSVTCDCFMQKPFWKIQHKANQKKIIRQFIELIDNASNLKIKYVILPLVDNGSLKNIYQKKELIMILKKLTNYIKLKKIMILFEFDSSPKFITNFLKNLDLKVFGINYDTGNSASYGYNVDFEFRAYSKLIKNIHLKDKNINGQSVALGEGTVNFNKFFKNLLKYKYNGNLILQTARSKNRMHVQEIKKNIKFISQYLK